jgi:hypothetical protein
MQRVEKSMVTCNLQGGIGNQMFQIATTISYAKKIGSEYFFDFGKCYTPNQGKTSNHYSNTIFKNIKNEVIDNNDNLITYQELNFNFSEIPNIKNVILNGYFQSEKYFKDYENYIREIFYNDDVDTRVNDDLNTIRKGKTLTSIHVRRGDYLKFVDVHPVCPLDYYQKSMELIGESNFIIISDDIEWCKENIKGENIFYSEYDDEIYDLCLIKNCDNNINANSSFSWWGAWLNKNNNKKIICPKIWFSEKSNIDDSDLIPKEWIRI